MRIRFLFILIICFQMTNILGQQPLQAKDSIARQFNESLIHDSPKSKYEKVRDRAWNLLYAGEIDSVY